MVGQLFDDAFDVQLRKRTSGPTWFRRRDRSGFSSGGGIDAQKIRQRQNDHPGEESLDELC